MPDQHDPEATQVFSNATGSITNRSPSYPVQLFAEADCSACKADTVRHTIPETWPSMPEPPPEAELEYLGVREPYRPTLATRILRNVTYLVVIVTCLYLLLTLFQVNEAVEEVQKILRDWADGFAGNLLAD